MSQVVVERIEAARAQLAEGKLGQADGTLGDVVKATDDPALLNQMREIALEGLERSGRFSKGPWKHLLADVEKQLARVAA